jgi:hypothetical protein
MGRLPEGRREVYPSKERVGDRKGPSFGPSLNISVAISVGLPLIVVGLFMGITGATRDHLLLLVLGAAVLILGVLLFASGRRL